jgi:hypothetical protein
MSQISKIIGTIMMLILVYLFLAHGSSTIGIINTIATNSVAGI